MKNKYFLFAVSLGITIFIIALLSVFIENTVFSEIAKVISLPFMLFSIASVVMSIGEEIIYICETKVSLEQEKINTWTVYKEYLSAPLKLVQKYSEVQNENQKEINDLYDKQVEAIRKADDQIFLFNLNIANCRILEDKCIRNLPIQIFYVATLILVISSMMLASLLSPYCNFVPDTTLTLLSLFLTIAEILVKTPLANLVFNYKFKKLDRKSKERTGEQNDGKTQNDVDG